MLVAATWVTVLASGCQDDPAPRAVEPVPTEAPSPDLATAPTTAPPGTTAAPTTAPERVEGWFESVLDPNAGVVNRFIALAGADDLPIVVYQREMGRDELSLWLARCLDPACGTVDLVDLETPGDGWLGEAAVRADGAPVIVRNPVGYIPDGESLLMVCDTPECATVSERSFPGVSVSSIAVDASGLPLMVVSEWPDPNRNEALLSLLMCSDEVCTDYRTVELARADGGHGAVQIDFLPTGAPVVSYDTVVGMGGTAGIEVLACSDPACADVTLAEPTDRSDVTDPGPMFAYVEGETQAVHLVRCVDATCAETVRVEVYREFEGRSFRVVASPYEADDGSAMLLVEAQPAWSGMEAGEPTELLAIRCLDPACEETAFSEGPLATGDSLAALWLDDGVAVVGYTGEGMLCDPYGENCADPDAEGLGRLDITLCRGEECSAGLATVRPEDPAVDTSGAPLDGDVVFAREGDIWLIEAGSSTPVNLTETWDWEGGPAWSPDGMQIAFHAARDEMGEESDIYVMNRDGSDVERVTDDPAAEFFPSWSPDGTRLAFSRENTTDDLRHLVILELASRTEFDLTDEDRNGDIPRWSPDGSMVVFGRQMSGSCDWGEPCNSSIFVINADGTGERQLTFADGTHWFPDWSPDGRLIAFHGTADDPVDRIDWNVYTVDVESMIVTRLTDYAGGDQSHRLVTGRQSDHLPVGPFGHRPAVHDGGRRLRPGGGGGYRSCPLRHRLDRVAKPARPAINGACWAQVQGYSARPP